MVWYCIVPEGGPPFYQVTSNAGPPINGCMFVEIAVFQIASKMGGVRIDQHLDARACI